MDDLSLSLLLDLHLDGERQGPGCDEQTRRAIALAGLERYRHARAGSTEETGRPLRIADIGCGTGSSSLVLARDLHAEIVAVDLFPEFLERLEERAAALGLEERIQGMCASMDELPFEEESFDVIWSEGAVYNMGFERGVGEWRRFLAPGGTLVVSELSWLGAERPQAIADHWEREYPEIGPISAKIAGLERGGYVPTGHFILPESCWIEQYYAPMEARFEAFLSRHGNSVAAMAVVEAEREEMALYRAYGAYYGYGMYVGVRR